MPFPPVNELILCGANGGQADLRLDPRIQQIARVLGLQRGHHEVRRLKKHVKRRIQEFQEEYRVMATFDGGHHVMVNLDELTYLEEALDILREHIKVDRQEETERNANLNARQDIPLPRILPYSEPAQNAPEPMFLVLNDGMSQISHNDELGQARTAATSSSHMSFQGTATTAIPFTTIKESNKPLPPIIPEQYPIDRKINHQSSNMIVKTKPTEVKSNFENAVDDFARASRKSLGISLSKPKARGPKNGVKKAPAKRTPAKRTPAKRTRARRVIARRSMTMQLRPRRN